MGCAEVDEKRVGSPRGWGPLARLSYRTGALVDLAAAIGMAFPGRLWPLRFAAQLQRGHAKL
jgi:hypothetical protein